MEFPSDPLASLSILAATSALPDTLGNSSAVKLWHSRSTGKEILAPVELSDESALLGFTVPLTRVPRSQLNPSAREGTSAANGDIQVISAQEYSYLIDVQIGGQDFRVVLDTGSSDLWVVSSECKTEDCEGVPQYRNTSTLALSSTPFNLGYLTGSVSGIIGYETVTFGQFDISSQVFALAEQTASLGLSATRSSGILGLAFPSEAFIGETSGRTLLENVFSHLDGPDQFFAYGLGRGTAGSTFSLGELDPTIAQRSSEFLFLPVYAAHGVPYDFWKLPLLSVAANASAPFTLSPSKVPGAGSPIAVLDTGTTLVLGPTADVDRFWGAVGGASKGSDNQWRVKCSHAVSVSLVLGNATDHREFALDPSDVNWAADEQGGDGLCLGGIQGNDGVSSGDWLLGDVFLRNVYVTHHAATASAPPLVGLLGVTDASEALTQFRAMRGADPSPANGLRAWNTSHPRAASTHTAVCGLMFTLGFLGSAGIALFVRGRRATGQRRKRQPPKDYR